jgi:hypothetical protein
MPNTDYLTFKGATHYGDSFLMNMLEVNLKMWYDWSFLKIGGWVNVAIPTAGAWGGDFSKLRLVRDEGYTVGQVWESIKKDWVWEDGVDYVDKDGTTRNPLVVGTPTVNNVTSAVPFTINYPLGRIIFDTPISSTATVKLPYSYRAVQVYRADDAPWFFELQFGSNDANSPHFAQNDDGSWMVGANHRVQMPCIIIEAIPRADSTGYELGNGSLVIRQDVLFHVVAETRNDRNKLIDVIRQQSDKGIWLFHVDNVIENDDFPLDENGSLVGSKTYPELVATEGDGGYRWRQCHMTRAVVSELQSIHPKLHEGTVRTTMEVVLGGV